MRCSSRPDDCALTPCRNGGVCSDGVRSYTCDCSATDYSGSTCTTRIDDCASDPCQNGGECRDGVRSYTCDCSDVDYSGSTCTTRIDDCASVPCRNGGRCSDGVRSYTCNCSGTGYTGSTCTAEIDECASRPCMNGGRCTDLVNAYRCDCSGTGYTGTRCQTRLCGNGSVDPGEQCDPGASPYTCSAGCLRMNWWAMCNNSSDCTGGTVCSSEQGYGWCSHRCTAARDCQPMGPSTEFVCLDGYCMVACDSDNDCPTRSDGISLNLSCGNDTYCTYAP